jgi:hypothetical protein
VLHTQAFGRYEIIRKLSRSMTDVYLAHDPERGCAVVLKMIERSGDEWTQLVIEAERRGALIQKQLHEKDRRILQIYDHGELNHTFFVAMEYFEGRTLAEILQQEKRLEGKRAARFAAEICSQLRTLHSFVSNVDGRRTAVVHGDIKPSNVQVGGNDELRLLDFGIAKVITFTHNLTHHNLGSPSYCSPERLRKAQVDQHADLWALGVSLYEMLSGSPPYQAQDTRKLENLIQSCRPPRALPEGCPGGLRSIVTKALAADIQRRYASAELFEGDLRAFLEDRPVAAAVQTRITSWNANATIDRNPGTQNPTRISQKAPTFKTLARRSILSRNIGNLAVALMAGVLVGLLLFLPMGYYYRFSVASAPLRVPHDYAQEEMSAVNVDWVLYRDLKSRNDFLGSFSPMKSVEETLRGRLVSAADTILDSFRNSADGRLEDFEWAKARLCLAHALEINPGDSKSRGKLDVCDGYLNLIRNPKPPRADLSVNNFRRAQRYLPKSPDPHLGLARVYVYADHNVGQAIAELHQAEQAGYTLGPKEMAEEADGYLFRAETELEKARRTSSKSRGEKARWLQLSFADMDRARRLYEPIAGFSNVSAHLEQVYLDESEHDKLENDYVQDITATKPKPAKHFWNLRRWR